MERRFSVTMGDIQKYKVIEEVLEKKIKATEAARLLDLRYVHTLRLKKKVKEEGIEVLMRRIVFW